MTCSVTAFLVDSVVQWAGPAERHQDGKGDSEHTWKAALSLLPSSCCPEYPLDWGQPSGSEVARDRGWRGLW